MKTVRMVQPAGGQVSPSSEELKTVDQSAPAARPVATPTAFEPKATQPVLAPGHVLQHYEIIRKLGAGGMGSVFLARDTRLGRLVAIKLLLVATGIAAQRFLSEARTTAQCRHENIVVIYDVGEIYGYPYMVLEYIQGRTLRQAMQDGVHPSLVPQLMLPVARALGCAHEMGIVHRDLKPENILLAETGAIKVVDFGIAKHFDARVPDAPGVSGSSLPAELNAELTQEGIIVGTIPYMSPEQLAQTEVDARTDIWAAGIMLFEMAMGVHPFKPITIDKLIEVKDVDVPMPSVREMRPELGPIGEIIDKCLRKNKNERYRSGAELVEALETLCAGSSKSTISDEQNPFAGLSAFQESDSEKFFGRDAEIVTVLGRLRNQPLVAIAGPSGAGKSSLVRAGVIPALKQSARKTDVMVVRPGNRPLMALAEAIMMLADTATEPENTLALTTSLISTLRTQPGHMGVRLRTRCTHRGSDHRLLLFIDQLEELYTLGADPEERATFYACLEGVADDASSPLRVIFTVRADYLDRIMENRRFWGDVSRGLVILPVMAPESLRETLEAPLIPLRYAFEDRALVDEMLAGLSTTRSPLPLLQFAAAKLWESRDRERRLLTRQAYRALGGVVGALSTHADAVFTGMSPAAQQLARVIFLRLVTPEKTRAVVRLDELLALSADPSLVETVVQLLADARLIAIDAGGDGHGKTVELTHESLMDRWSRLRQWLDESERDVEFLAELRHAAAQWEKNGRASDFLWRDRSAIEAEQWAARQKARGHVDSTLGLGQRESDYLQAVIRFAASARWRKRATIAGLFAAVSLVAVVVSVLAIDARAHARRADAEAKRADQQAIQAREEARQARNATRLAAARELQTKDPTKAFSLLREIEPGPLLRGWADLVLWTRHAGVAESVREYPDAAMAAAYSPDGQRIAVSVYDKTILVWNVDGSGSVVTLRGHKEAADSIDWSHDGRRIAAGSRDSNVRIWNADGSGTPIVLTGHQRLVRTVDWSPDDRELVTSSGNGDVRIWPTDGSSQHVILGGPTPKLGSMTAAWSPDGQQIAVGANDGTVQIWNVTGKAPALVLEGHQNPVLSVDWSPDGQRIVSASWDKTLRIWNASGKGKPIVLEGHQDRVYHAKWSPDGKRIASGSQDKTVRVWDVNGYEEVVVLRGHDERVAKVSWSPDGLRLISAAFDRDVRTWNVDRTQNSVILRGHTGPISRASFSPDGRRLVTASDDRTLRLWDLQAAAAPIVLTGHDNLVISASFRRDGQKIVSGSHDCTVRIWNADGSGQPIVLRGHEKHVWGAVFTPDGQRVVSISEDKTVRVWNANGEGEPLILRGHDDRVYAVAISPDGQRIATGSKDMTVQVRRLDGTGEPLVLRGHTDGVWGVGWSPDGKRIVSGAEDRTLRLWSADGSGVPMVFEGHRSLALVQGDLPFTPDGRRIVSSSNDGTVRVWNTEGTGESIVLHAGDSASNSATWSADGRRIAAPFENGTVKIWNDVYFVEDSSDSRLWRSTQYCMPLDLRQRLLGFTNAQARADLERCENMVGKVSPETPKP